MILVARWRGVAALVGLALAYGVLAYFMLPALVDGHSPVAVAMVGGAAILLVALYVAHGFSFRTTTALLGTLIALLITAGFAAWATDTTRLTGRSNEINADLQATGIPVSVSGLILCGLIVGALGVINDITVTQASSVWELSAAEPGASWRTLFTRGMRIGRDHIASVVYTIVFAYTGAALPVLLLFSISGRSLHDLLTGDEIATEIVRNLVAGCGLVLAVPFTTLIAALVAARPHEARNDDQLTADHDQPTTQQPPAVEFASEFASDPGLDALEARIAAADGTRGSDAAVGDVGPVAVADGEVGFEAEAVARVDGHRVGPVERADPLGDEPCPVASLEPVDVAKAQDHVRLGPDVVRLAVGVAVRVSRPRYG